MKVVAFYDRSTNELTLDKELDSLVGKRHQHSGVHFPTMRRDLTWFFDDPKDARSAHIKLSKHNEVIEVVLG